MSNKIISTHHDHKKVGKIIDALFNPLSTADRTTLGGTLGAGNAGLFTWDTDLDAPYWWDGGAWATPAGTQSGLTPQGSIAFNGAEPGSPVLGDLWVFNTAGSNTWEGTNVVQIGDQAWWDGTAWQFIQGNAIDASETVPGLIELATQAEVNTGTDALRAITPATLSSWRGTKKIAGVYYAGSLTLVADTPLTVTHSLALQNRNAFVAAFYVSNSEEDVDIDSIDANSLSITSNRAITGGEITVIGF